MQKILLTLMIAASGLLAMLMPQPVWVKRTADAVSRDRDRLIAAFDRLQSDYVDEIDQSAIVTAAISAMADALESSEYIDPQGFRDLMVIHRPFADPGLALVRERGLTKVVTPRDGSPAARAGVKPSDIITHIDDVPLQGQTLSQTRSKLYGIRNTTVRLRIIRDGRDAPIELTVARDDVRVRAVSSHLEGDDIAYIRVAVFNEQTANQLQAAIRSVWDRTPADKLKGYVLDLRNNEGWLVDQAVSTADAFLHDGEIVSLRRGRSPEHSQRLRARPGDLIDGKPLIALINSGSAAGAEIVAGALQHHKRATVIGKRSFGRGAVTTSVVPGPGQGMFRLTTARYFTPAGRSIQAEGIVPDIQADEDIPENPENDRTLQMAYAMLRGMALDPALPPG